MTTNKLERIIKYNFNNVNLLKEALIHSSYSSRSCKKNKKNYERLEFLGDRVLGLVLAEYVFHVFPEANEGLLNSYYQKYVSQEYLFNYSKKIHLSNFIKTQKGDKLDDNKSILSDVVESIIGAIYLDSNYSEVLKFLDKFSIHFKNSNKDYDFKGMIISLRDKGELSEFNFNTYRYEGTEFFLSNIEINKYNFYGFGNTKKDAEIRVSNMAYKFIKNL